jgi:hypothetical protein
MGTTTPLYQGTVTGLRGSQLTAVVHSTRQHVQLGISLRLSSDGRATGDVRGTSVASGST